ncbi:MAG: toll/interleukin-1 receptor domain-containing protein, partial [Natronosporangium sp.]
MDRWDVFVSYARRDAARVRPLAAALTGHGLRVFLDEYGVRDFRSLSRIIGTELGRAKLLLAYYSITYPTRPACQWELTVAYLAGQREGDPLRRVLVVNPEPAAGHIHPVELRDTRRWPGLTRAALAELVGQVAGHVRGLAGPIGLA